ncbi:hypothetical protein [Rubrivirga sp.]|uniref:hypothetical protein n=1 Tax=Rubrivirga sp. TaxID=1885344 RepID=UPI003C77DF44
MGCAAFGLFHWPGGAWYMVATGVLLGLPCWWLRATYVDLASPYAAHLVLNVLEVVISTKRARSEPVRPRGRT